MTRALVAGWIGSSNLGDELIFRALRRRLHTLGAEVAAISTDPEATRRVHGVPAIGHLDLAGLVTALGSADVLAFGGGDLIQDVSSPFNLPYHLGRVGLARLRRVPVAGVGVGVPPFGRRGSRTLTRRGWPADAPIAVRDHPSARRLAALGLPARVAADLAFGLPDTTIAPDDVITVCLRAWSGGSVLPAERSWAEGMDDGMLDATAAALDDLAHRTGLRLELVGLQPDRDGRYHRAVADRLRRADARLVTPTLDTVLDDVGRGRLVVATRYHGAVAGLLAHRPVVALDYAHKVAALAADAPASIARVEFSPDGVGDIAEVGPELLRRAPDVAADTSALRARERVNAEVLELLLERGSA